MQVVSESEHSALPNPDEVNERLREFWRLRRHAEPDATRFQQQYVDDQGVTPLDSTKTFVGDNGTYYDERWRYMEWRSRRRSWNWAPVLTMGAWLAYRRMYGLAASFVVALGLLTALAVNGVMLWPLLAVFGLGLAVMALYGNALYLLRFRKAAMRAARGDGQHQDRLNALARSGGTDPLAAWMMVITALMTVLAAVLGTFWIRGSIVLFVW